MEKQRIVNNLKALGDFFSNHPQPLKDAEIKAEILSAKQNNPWFTETSVEHAFRSWAEALQEEKIKKWLEPYSIGQDIETRKVGVIMAGNIPMVGLHDALSVLISGHYLLAKLSSRDEKLMNLILKVLSEIDADWGKRIEITDRLNQAELLIATGSDNSARYFEYYFRDKPRIIRKNRTALAVLSEQCSDEQLEGLAKDVFTYFGLGCRNVTKLYLPQEFNLERIFKAFYLYKDIINHHQYANNYDYNKAVYLMNKIDLLENGFILLKEDEGLHSPLGVLFYERYSDMKQIEKVINSQKDQIQLVVSDLNGFDAKAFGEAQKPDLWDYADGVDTLEFLLEAGS